MKTKPYTEVGYNLTTEDTALFYISHYSAVEFNPFHYGSVAENTTEQVNWYF